MTKKILIVEDDNFIADLYDRELSNDGFEVKVAKDGIEGELKAKELQPDLILLDIMLPNRNGLDLLKILKEDPLTQKFKVLVLSNLGQEEAIKKALDMGAEGYLIKSSYTPKEVLNEIKTFFK
jgi:two-component system alkaline phosphatase synthesis response regulator PhoP